ncbi:MAG: DUF4249 domain-containing protein [Bacteroidia bacterium]|nr:DUF4249 domain-containing protein [Bacteroidia bacterium]
MNNLILRYMLILLGAGLAACEGIGGVGILTKEFSPDLPEVPRLAVQCFISPQDTVVGARITWVEPTVGPVDFRQTQFDVVRNAWVVLSNGPDSLYLDSFSVFRGEYVARTQNFPIEGGQTYFLLITTPEGYSVKSSCTVPASVVNAQSVEILKRPNQTGGFEFLVRWQDIPGEINYYSLHELVLFQDTLLTRIQAESTQYNFSGEENDGGFFTSEPFPYTGSVVFNSGNRQQQLVFINHVDKNYYEFHRTLIEQTLRYVDGGTFAEPLEVYSNIEGGYGVFAGYNRLSVVVP